MIEPATGGHEDSQIHVADILAIGWCAAVLAAVGAPQTALVVGLIATLLLVLRAWDRRR